MHFSALLASAAALATVQAQYAGFNYGSTFTDGSAKQQSDFEAEFSRAKTLQGTNGEFTSARLYTMIQGGTTDTPISAIPAAIDTKTTLLLGLWASAGQADMTNEITALKSAISQYGTAFTSLIAGISVGSEDLYRISPTGIENNSGAGANPSDLISYISQVRAAIADTSASGAMIGHVDTWTAYVNGSNAAVISACDWLGMDAYPYFQNTIDNGINVANSTFFEAYDNTVAAAQGKPVWITETGWPVSGPTENQAVASAANAQLYWEDVACTVLGKINTWWYILQDAQPTTPSPSFGIVGADLSSAPLYNLTCNNSKSAASSSSSTTSNSATSITSSAASATAPASATGANSESLSAATPGPESSPTSVSISQTSAHSVTAVASGTASAASTSESTGPVAPTSATASSAASASKSSAPVTSSVAVSSAPIVTASTAVSASTTVSGGKTYTTYQTTLITITSCSSGCSNTAKASPVSPSASSYSSASSSAPASVSISAQSSIKASSATSAASTPSSCPANLSGEYQYPHLIVPVDSSNPTKAAGTQYFGTITPTISTIFNFDLPYTYVNKTCSLVFLFPQQAALETSSFTFNGVGGIVVNELSEPATETTSWNTVPAPAVAGLGSIANVQSGNNYIVASHQCAAGSRIGFEFQSTGGLNLTWFNDWNPSPIGAFISVC